MKGIPVLLSLGASTTVEGEQSDTMQLLTAGELFHLEDGYRLCYEESLENAAPATRVEIVMQGGVVTMLRSGEYAADMVFHKGQRYEGVYHTPYGTMDLGIYCTKAIYHVDEGGGSLTLQYQLDLNGQYASMHDLQLRFMAKEGAPAHDS